MLSVILILLERTPESLAVIEKLKYLTPKLTLSKIGRPTFDQLPLDLGIIKMYLSFVYFLFRSFG